MLIAKRSRNQIAGASTAGLVIGVAAFVVWVGLVWHFFQPPQSTLSPRSLPEPERETHRSAANEYHKEIQPILKQFCFDCHGEGMNKGNMALDEFKDDADLLDHKSQWLSVLKNIRAGVMPPPGKPRPSAAQQRQLVNWIKYGAFGIDPNDPDPGRVTIHRLNRVEYRNSILQLLGVDYNTEDEFPPDGAGLGLDNMADLLTMSPLILEKYLKAAESALDGALPAEKVRKFEIPGSAMSGYNNSTNGARLFFSGAPEVVYIFRNKNPGQYHVSIELEVVAQTTATNICRFTFSEQSGTKPREALVEQEFKAESNKYEFAFDRNWTAESHTLAVAVVNPNARPAGFGFGFGGANRVTNTAASPHVKITRLRIDTQPTEAIQKYFAGDAPTAATPQILTYIRDGVSEFALRAFRRPIDEPTLNRLTKEISERYSETGVFGESLKPTLAKILCSPRFLFRAAQIAKPEKNVAPVSPWEGFRSTKLSSQPAHNEAWLPLDEYSLASRLSYFLWSAPPDDELLNLASRGELRKNLASQIKRMIEHPNANNLIENFSGQWLQTRNVMKWGVVEYAILKREGKSSTKPLLTDAIRQAMKDETTMYFNRILKEDRSVLEFIDSDYTYLNEALAGYYEIPGITGSLMQLVTLTNSPRGGVLTHGSTLLVTSVSNRTSPVKRGVFVLDTLLGLRPHDPPPDVPGIEQASNRITNHEPTFRESLELHRQDALCASCHKLMDPIGFGLDNFNALGMYREKEFGQPIDASGKLASGEEFNGVRELKQILKTSRRGDYYRCLTEKLMTYAVGRGLEYYDVEAVDQVVDRLEKENGRFSALLMGIINSAPFQKRRVGSSSSAEAAAERPAQPVAGRKRMI